MCSKDKRTFEGIRQTSTMGLMNMSETSDAWLIANFIDWARKNAIRLDLYDDSEVMEMIMRFQTAAG